MGLCPEPAPWSTSCITHAPLMYHAPHVSQTHTHIPRVSPTHPLCITHTQRRYIQSHLRAHGYLAHSEPPFCTCAHFPLPAGLSSWLRPIRPKATRIHISLPKVLKWVQLQRRFGVSCCCVRQDLLRWAGRSPWEKTANTPPLAPERKDATSLLASALLLSPHLFCGSESPQKPAQHLRWVLRNSLQY